MKTPYNPKTHAKSASLFTARAVAPTVVVVAPAVVVVPAVVAVVVAAALTVVVMAAVVVGHQSLGIHRH